MTKYEILELRKELHALEENCNGAMVYECESPDHIKDYVNEVTRLKRHLMSALKQFAEVTESFENVKAQAAALNARLKEMEEHQRDYNLEAMANDH